MVRGAAESQRRAAACDLGGGPAAAIGPADDVTFELPERVRAAAERDIEAIADPQQATFTIEGLGAEYFRQRGLSPVPAFTVALQRTVNRLTGRTPHILQFLAMSRYRCADLVHADVTTPEVLRFVEAAAGGQPDGELLRAALASHVEACRAARRHLPLLELVGLYFQSIPAARRLRTSLAMGGAALALRALGLLRRPARTEIMISHPAAYPEIPIVGRPGVRIPHVRDLTLHFQLLPDRTAVTLAPSPEWPTANAELMADLRASLELVAAAGERSAPGWTAPQRAAGAGSLSTQRS
jgi:hypothetical protein